MDVMQSRRQLRLEIKEVVKTTILEQDPTNHKIDGGLYLYPLSSYSKDGIFFA